MKVSSVSEMRNLDKTAIEKFAIKEELLMENAGGAVYFVIANEFGIQGKKFVVFCGIGNNGGDGLVIARKIYSNGGKVKVFFLGDPDKFKGAAGLNWEIISRLPIDTHQINTMEDVKSDLAHCDAIVDAIFGTGLARDVGGRHAEVIGLVNGSGKTVFSADIPSGVDGDSGRIMGVAVRADYTITFGLPKIGNMLYPGYELCGRLYVTHISFPPSLCEADFLKIEINNPGPLPPRNIMGHKGTFGDVLFVAGASSYFGAPYFSALSFLKAGGGYSRLAAPRSMTPFIANKGSEIVFVPQKETATGSLALENKESLLRLTEKVDMVVLGPGLSLAEETQQLVLELAEKIERPLILDGDGITAACKDLKVIRKRKAETVLTPHLGEMSRITKKSQAEIDMSRIEILQRTTKDLNATIVLKGAHSLIGFPDGAVFINMTGNSGMATAGSGDVLAGAIAAMFGLGLKIREAVKKGVYTHGLSGDLAAEDEGEDGITAQDIMEYLSLTIKMDREGLDEIYTRRYSGPKVI